MKKDKRRPQGATRSANQKPARKPLPERVSLRLPMRLLRTLAVCGVLVVMVMGSGRLLDSLDQPITRVKVYGELTHIDEQAIAQWVEGQITEGVLSMDLRNLQTHLQAQPWVASAAVRRQWPGVLAISLSERVAVARWNEAGLLTAEGTVFKPPQLPLFEQLPHLWGADASAIEVLKQFHWMQQQFAGMRLQVVALSKAHRGAWQVELVTQAGQTEAADQSAIIQVALGKQELSARMARFKTLYDSVLQARINEIERVDLRYTNGVAVQWKAAEKVS